MYLHETLGLGSLHIPVNCLKLARRDSAWLTDCHLADFCWWYSVNQVRRSEYAYDVYNLLKTASLSCLNRTTYPFLATNCLFSHPNIYLRGNCYYIRIHIELTDQAVFTKYRSSSDICADHPSCCTIDKHGNPIGGDWSPYYRTIHGSWCIVVTIAVLPQHLAGLVERKDKRRMKEKIDPGIWPQSYK